MGTLFQTSKSQPGNPPVWIVDDDDDDQVFIQSAFEENTPSIQVLPLTDGYQLLTRLQKAESLPRLIILDVNMPGMSGFDTLLQLRNTPAYADLPVVLMTTSSDPDDQARGLALGANQFLTKPNTYQQLSSITQLLTRQWVATD